MKHACGAPPFALRLECDGKSLAYTGDTEWVDALIPAAREADLFIAEAYFWERKVKYHLDWLTLKSHLGEIRANCGSVDPVPAASAWFQHRAA